MGSSASSPVPLAPAFQRMSTWELKNAKRLLHDYKGKDLDFRLDAQALRELLAGDKDWAAEITDASSSTNGIGLRCAGLDATEQISMDEMTIVFLCATRGLCVVSGVGAVPSDEDLEDVTLGAYRELNISSGQSISKAEFTKWVLKFAAGDSTTSHSEVTIQSAMEQFGGISPPKAGVTTEYDELGNPAGGDENNPPEQQVADYYQLEAEARSVEASTFDEAYQAQEVPRANGNELADEALGAFSATEAKFEASPEEGAYSEPKPLQHAQELLPYEENTNEYEEAPGFEAEASEGSVEVAHAAPAQDKGKEGQEAMAQSDEPQEDYGQEFAALQEEEVYVEQSSSAGQFEVEPVGGEEPSTPVSDEVLASSEAQDESDGVDQQASNASLSAETEETFEERLPVQQESSQGETMPPVPRARVEEGKEEETFPEKQAPPAFEVPELESEANYEDDGYDLPSARDEDEAPPAATDAVLTDEPSVEAEEVDSPLPVSSPSEELDENVPKEDATEDSGGGVDLNDFEAYDYTRSEYDASSGLPPPEDPADYATEESDTGTADPNADPDATVGDAVDEAASVSPLLSNEETDTNPGKNRSEDDVGNEATSSKAVTQELQIEEA